MKAKKNLPALGSAIQASAIHPNAQTFNVIGLIYDRLNEAELAAYAFDEAERYGKSHNDKDTLYFYYRGALAYLRSGSAEFAYIRSQTAIEFYEHGKFSTEPEVLEHLHVCRMISAMQHLKGTDALNTASKDAHWLLKNGNRQEHKDMAMGVLSGKVMAFSMTTPWPSDN